MRTAAAAFIAITLLTPALASAATRSLSQGMNGTDVTALQQLLIQKGYLSASATGYFGPQTAAAVKKFQCDSGVICSGAAYGLVGPATRAALGLGGSKSSFEISGWIPYWRAATGTIDVIPHLSGFTSIMPFGYIVQNDGSLHDGFGLDAPMSTTSAALVAVAKAHGVRVVPTIMWSNQQAIYNILSNQQTRIALEDRIADLAKANDFDGVDIDFENKSAETAPYFATFLKGLYQRMGKKWVYCAIEPRTPISSLYDGTPPAGAGTYANDYSAINKYCDRVEIMAYDQQTADVKLDKSKTEAGGPYIPISDPDWVKKVVALTAQSIPKSKLVLGVATYGYEWKVTPLQISGFRFDMQWAFNPRYGTALATSIGAKPWRNQAGELSFIYDPNKVSKQVAAAASAGEVSSTSGTGMDANGTAYSGKATLPSSDGTYNIVWWSDAKAIAEKVALAKQLGLKGVAVFKIDGGEDPGLWDALK